MHANLYQTQRAEFIAITDEDAMQAGIELAQTEGIIPAIETAHAFAVLKHKKFLPNDVVVINLSGRGDKDLNTYINYFTL
jgi:tryptophan synthase beta chain